MEKFMESVFKMTLLLISISVIAIFAFISLFIFTYGLPAIFEIGTADFLLGNQWQPTADVYGIFPMILASIYVTAGAALLSFPIGILTAVFLSETMLKKTGFILRFLIKLLAGLPSVIFGFFGLAVIVPVVMEIKGSGNSLLSAILVLSMMMLPTVISISEKALLSVPAEFKEASYALGETKLMTIFKITIPAARSGIIASLILGTGRAMGEATAVALVAGNKVRIPGSIFDSVRTLATNCVFEMGYATELHLKTLFSSGAVLFAVIMVMNIILIRN